MFVAVLGLLLAFIVAVQGVPACAQGSAEWQGEWGSFQPAAKGRYVGAGLRIGECSATACTFAIDANTATGNGNAKGTLQTESASTATAHLAAFGTEHCTLHLVRNADTITSGTGAGDCSYFQTPGVSFLGTFQLHTHTLFTGDRAPECFSANDPATLALCTNDALAKQQDKWLLLFYGVTELEGASEESARAQQAQAVILQSCEASKDTAACLATAYARSTADLQQRRDAWRASVNTPGDPFLAVKMAQSIAGNYRHRFRNGNVQGDNFMSTDTLKLSALPGGELRYKVNLEFYNGHECSIDGTASLRKAGMFVDVKPSQDAKEMACYFEIKPTAGGVAFGDPTGQCKMQTCGARGGYSGAEFRLKDRITLPRKKP